MVVDELTTRIEFDSRPTDDKAVCADCIHVRKAPPTTYANGHVELNAYQWTCKAVPLRTIRSAITGVEEPAWTEAIRCGTRNANGECTDFVAHRHTIAAPAKSTIEDPNVLAQHDIDADNARARLEADENKLAIFAVSCFVLSMLVGVVIWLLG
jgi:hypothetical protein